MSYPQLARIRTRFVLKPTQNYNHHLIPLLTWTGATDDPETHHGPQVPTLLNGQLYTEWARALAEVFSFSFQFLHVAQYLLYIVLNFAEGPFPSSRGKNPLLILQSLHTFHKQVYNL